MINQFLPTLSSIEADIGHACRAAGQTLVQTFRDRLQHHNLKRHRLTIEGWHGAIMLHVNGEPWLFGQRDHRGLAVAKLLDDIADILEKCDNAVNRTITGTVL